MPGICQGCLGQLLPLRDIALSRIAGRNVAWLPPNNLKISTESTAESRGPISAEALAFNGSITVFGKTWSWLYPWMYTLTLELLNVEYLNIEGTIGEFVKQKKTNTCQLHTAMMLARLSTFSSSVQCGSLTFMTSQSLSLRRIHRLFNFLNLWISSVVPALLGFFSDFLPTLTAFLSVSLLSLSIP